MSSVLPQASRTVELVPLSQPLVGDYSPPADASAGRLALCSAMLCSGPLLLRGSLPDSLQPLLDCLQALGLSVSQLADGLSLERGSLPEGKAELQLQAPASEEEVLLLTALCAGLLLPLRLHLQTQLSSQAQAGLACLRQMGAELSYAPLEGGAELAIVPAPLRSASLELPAGLPWLNGVTLIAASAAGIELTIREARNAHDHAQRLLRSLGVELYSSAEGITLPAAQQPSGAELKLPGCPELASARVVAALLLPGSDLSIQQVSMNPRRSALLKLLHECAPASREGMPGLARIRTWQFGHEPVAALRAVHTPRLRSAVILPNRAATLVADLPWLLLLASQGRGTSVLRGFDKAAAGPLRSAYLAEMLRAFGVDAEHDHDGWRISGPCPLLAAELQCLGDPLLTRCAVLLARFASGPSVLYSAAPVEDPLAWHSGADSQA
ncbi:hypothetical protein IT575_04740 [bacterium]|nr:hypothetical protein [bacterium]